MSSRAKSRDPYSLIEWKGDPGFETLISLEIVGAGA
jgi:hypothetical protein